MKNYLKIFSILIVLSVTYGISDDLVILKALKEMKLHELKTIYTQKNNISEERITVLKVPGGYMYTHYKVVFSRFSSQSSVFIPAQ